MTDSDDPIIRGWKEIVTIVRKSRSQLWRDIKAGRFPAPLDLGPMSVGWLRAEITDWIALRPRRKYGAQTAARAEPRNIKQRSNDTISALPRRRGRPRKEAKRSTDDSTDGLVIRTVVAKDNRAVCVPRWMQVSKEGSGFLEKAA